MGHVFRSVITALLFACFAVCSANAQSVTVTPPPATSATPDNAILLTIFLKHDQSRPLSELNAQLTKQGFYKAFPPAGIEVLSWYVTMGIGQVITLRLPASRIREVNRILEDTAWAVTGPSSTPLTTTKRSDWQHTTTPNKHPRRRESIARCGTTGAWSPAWWRWRWH